MTTVKPVTDDDESDGWTEVVDATIGRVDLVGKAANGTGSFLIMKATPGSGGGLVDPDVVRELIAKATLDPKATLTATTYTGSPRDVMAAIHAASTPSKETAMPKAAVLKADDAQQAADAVIGDDAPLPDADETAVGASDGADGAGVPTPAPGDPDDPKSAAWEAVDAARARQALQLTVALQRLVSQATDREAQELAVPGGEGDLSDVWTLEDVSCAIDAIIAMLAPFAVTEQAEADQLTADAEGVLLKSGRVLSSANEAKIRGAADALQSVLGSLPAPVEDAAMVAKSEEETEVDTTIVKAKGDPQVAVYSADGKLVGTVDQADVNPIAEVAPPEGSEAAEPAAEEATETPVAEAAEPAPIVQPDATDGPAAGDVAPVAPVPPVAPAADEKVKKAEDDEISLLKSSLENAMEALRKQGERLELLEAQPMPGGPFLNGALPGDDPVALRGDIDEQSDLRKAQAYEDERDPRKKNELRTQLAIDGIRRAPMLR